MVCGIISIIAVSYKNPQYRQSSARSAIIAGPAQSAGRSSKVDDLNKTRADNSQTVSPLVTLGVLFLSEIVYGFTTRL